MPALVEKSPMHERVKSVAMEPAALLRTERTGMCAAQYFCAIRNGAAAVVVRGFLAAKLGTTLVLEPSPADFSTAAGNSALIVDNEISTPPCAAEFQPEATKKKNKKRDFHLTTIGSPGR
jgi:hypothetical protein